MVLFGIDPGLTGGLAVLSTDHGRWEAWKMPRVEFQISPKARKWGQVDAKLLDEIVELRQPDLIGCEIVQPHLGGALLSASTMCTNYGVLLSLRRRWPMWMVAPPAWKKYFGLSADKAEATLLARELFGPDAPKQDGPAEALLIALYTWEVVCERSGFNPKGKVQQLRAIGKGRPVSCGAGTSGFHLRDVPDPVSAARSPRRVPAGGDRQDAGKDVAGRRPGGTAGRRPRGKAAAVQGTD